MQSVNSQSQGKYLILTIDCRTNSDEKLLEVLNSELTVTQNVAFKMNGIMTIYLIYPPKKRVSIVAALFEQSILSISCVALRVETFLMQLLKEINTKDNKKLPLPISMERIIIYVQNLIFNSQFLVAKDGNKRKFEQVEVTDILQSDEVNIY